MIYARNILQKGTITRFYTTITNKISTENITKKTIKRPPFYKVFPKKKFISKILFELGSDHTYGKLYPIYESIYDNLDGPDVKIKVPPEIKANAMMLMKKTLERVRFKTKAINKHLLALENEILDKAAEMGDDDAISLLAFEVLKCPEENTKEDVEYAKKLIEHLYKVKKHPLTTKLAGDLALKNKDYDKALSFYKQFLSKENDTYLAGTVYEQIGKLYFQTTNLSEAENNFLKAIKYSPIEQVVQSYFYLSQLYTNSDPQKSKKYLEFCASQGFKESFKLLGFLEMNYFGDLIKAREWFGLGMEVFDLECYVGYFDCCWRLKSWEKCWHCYSSIKKLAATNERAKTLLHNFELYRRDTITELNTIVSREGIDHDNKVLLDRNGRWN
ncbi:related to Protein MSS2, mitochondrial [Saccharomycodes ludwigii]|uniref:Related to Protein MSS2, mitochondrial n=1 Tax=Saccharomycodes ludwigii TaxID=36035 RepID=A0A376B7B8_9ASCO|nr:hypothetical protein SCDLUD_002701 [Saccharomycodes ludwigii]KAH3901215.1 hypothetical protein SCDLUD_002701 [Saccharomycodes ludwigii]SSD60563.1 related to Protein MSS2, mitochondrial [Saccharomycodes ludwigii]